MGIGFRIFLVNDDDSLERLAVARYVSDCFGVTQQNIFHSMPASVCGMP